MAAAVLVCASSALLPGTAYASTATDDATPTPTPTPTPPSAVPSPIGPAATTPSPAALTPTGAAATTPSALSPVAAAAHATLTTSRYMLLFGTNETPDQIGYRTGCADGKVGASGLRVLFFGTQEADGRFRPPAAKLGDKNPRVDQAAIEQASLGWIKGFTQCGSATAVVAIATNNKADPGVDGAGTGTTWAKLVERIGAATPGGRVTVSGGLDGEPGYSKPAWARAWVDSFVRSSSRRLYVAGSADGCLLGQGENCANQWTVQDVYHMATGAGPNVYAVPQIYKTNGLQARQWAGINRLEQLAGKSPVRFASVLTQQKACTQRSGCNGIDNSPDQARDQLVKALADPGILGSSKNVSDPKDPDGSKDSENSDGSKSAGTVLDATKKAGLISFGSTDVAWPDDPSQLAWVAAQPIVPGGPTD
jgi:hypothetical protein